MEALGRRCGTALEVDADRFRERVESEAAELKAELEVGTFDNPQAIVGLEYEFYAVDRATDVLRRVPQPLLDLIGFEAELGVHNAELAGRPQPLGPHGLAALRHEVQSAVRTAHEAAASNERIRLVSDGLWTVPPVGETAAEYLGDSVSVEEFTLSPNTPESVRYHALSNSPYYRPRKRIEAPNATFEAPTVCPAALMTTIQPHYQMPVAADLPEYFGYALRVAAPFVAMAANSALFPPSVYDTDATVASVLETGHRESRVRVYESVMNDPDRPPKVAFPEDLESAAAAVDRVVEDPPITPALLDRDDRFDDRFVHLRHKHGSYWRWVRPVFDGETESAANARIEFRPLPAQPTVRDSVAMVAAFAGALRGLVRADHPVAALSWEQARENFYAAARSGLDADMRWVTAEGRETTDIDVIYRDLLSHAAGGLGLMGFETGQVDSYLDPLRARVERRTTPASWKRDRLRAYGENGESLSSAVLSVKSEYLDRQSETLLEGWFTDWPGV
jgi:hypothetical protein